MKDYVQVPVAELEKPYEFTSSGESTPFLYLSRSNDFILHVLVMVISTVFSCLVYRVILFMIITAIVILTLDLI